MINVAFNEGYRAYHNGADYELDNPYEEGTEYYSSWQDGYINAECYV